MLNKFIFSFSLVISGLSFSQEFNVYHLISENKKNSKGPNNLADFIYLNSNLKLTSYSIFHYTPYSIPDTTWKNKKKVVNYKNSKADCDFQLSSKFEKLLENHEMKVVGDLKKHLIISSASLYKVADEGRFIVHEIEGDSELEIQREINKIMSSAIKKSNIDVYIFTDKYQSVKPTFSFTSDSITGNNEIDIKFTTSTNPKNINWSSNVKLREGDLMRPYIMLNSNQSVKGSYIDENGCNSNEDEIKLNYKPSCNCEASMGKPEILYYKSKNIIDKSDEDEVEWDYKVIPEQSGSLVYELPVRKICADRFIVEVKSKNGKEIFREFYEMESVDERSENQMAKDSKNLLVFSLPLDEHRNLIELADSFFYISIIPEINGEECIKRKFISVKIRFSKCR
jgi:hypothetical protein